MLGAHGKLRPDINVRNEWVSKAYDVFPADAINVSAHDLPYLSGLFQRAGFQERARSRPFLNRLVSANTASDAPGFVAPPAFVVRELQLRSTGAKLKPIRVAFVGLTETTPGPPAGLKFIDPIVAAKRAIPDARKKADIVVMLAKVGSGEAKKLALEAPGADIIIAGSASIEESFTPPFYVGQTLVVFTPFETRMLGEIRFYASPQGKFSTKQRFISLDEVLPADPPAQKLVDAALRAEIDARNHSKQLLENWLATSSSNSFRRPANNSSTGESALSYVSSAVCSTCHVAEFTKWSSSAHARASDRLLADSTEFEASCLGCHATGPKSSAAQDKLVARFQSVQCEQCHGPGGEHAAKPAKGYGRVASMQAVCGSCHTSETSSGFDLKIAWEKIKH